MSSFQVLCLYAPIYLYTAALFLWPLFYVLRDAVRRQRLGIWFESMYLCLSGTGTPLACPSYLMSTYSMTLTYVRRALPNCHTSYFTWHPTALMVGSSTKVVSRPVDGRFIFPNVGIDFFYQWAALESSRALQHSFFIQLFGWRVCCVGRYVGIPLCYLLMHFAIIFVFLCLSL